MPLSGVKKHLSNKSFINELFVYQSDFPYKPELIEIRKPNTIVLRRVDGIPYLDMQELSKAMITKLAQTISRFHAVMHLEDRVLCHWDNQPRNILWDEQKQHFWLIDFEDIRLAHPEADIAHLFLFWAEVMSLETFKNSVNTFLKNYRAVVALNNLRWKKELKNAKARFYRRRRKYDKQEPVFNIDRLQNRMYLNKLIYFS